MLTNRYAYVAVFTYDEDGIVIEFPDLPGCCPCANKDDTEEALKNAQEALNLHVWNMIQDGENLPIPSKITEITLKQKQIPVLISTFVPYYDSTSRAWKLVTELGIEEGDATYIASEFVKGGLIYPFHSESPEKEKYHKHAHDFNSVVEFVLNKPAYFSIEGFEEYYSEQERELLNCLKM